MKRQELLEALSLGFISIKSMHGYVINNVLDKYDYIIKFSKASIYNTLKRVEQKGYAGSKQDNIDPNRPPKTFYYITEEGEEYLRELIRKMLTEIDFQYPFAYNGAVNLSFLFSSEEFIELLSSRLSNMRDYKKDLIEKRKKKREEPGLLHLDILLEDNYQHIKQEENKLEKLIELFRKDPEYGKKQKQAISKFIEV